ncbi:MAG: acyl-ACP--UDP-N-acetylglucosamine O-acyltransferase [Kiritimatiellia bacterium]
MQIHPTALVSKNAELADDVVVGPYAVIEDKVRLGAGVKVGPHAVIYPHTSVASGCSIHAHAVIGDLPQDLAYKDSVSYVRIGPGTTIREGVTIHRGTKPETVTEVGQSCYLMANSHLAHNVKLGNSVVIANGALLAGYVEVGERVFISGNCVIHQFVRIGRMAMLGGNSGISQDVLPFCTAASVRLNVTAGLNVVGLRRAGISAADRLVVKRIFMTIFRSGLNMSQAAEKVRREIQSPYATEMCEFIESSKRGICGFKSGQEDED